MHLVEGALSYFALKAGSKRRRLSDSVTTCSVRKLPTSDTGVGKIERLRRSEHDLSETLITQTGILSVLLLGGSSIFGAVNFIATIIQLRAPDSCSGVSIGVKAGSHQTLSANGVLPFLAGGGLCRRGYGGLMFLPV